ncbi:AraC family transcriptional regulator [Mycolicibacterium sp. 050158]|uniref:AraC family transcriptional regulator n=1 Tax=Mycolicibacterium sp. 050158 TaxID=3090602 RepID=UPI00299D9DA8|nr:AraC family transcriptional regulator [Mycolicibacterium sp. 050158]MDX1891674.1 AraC family transcriptional regulator [Mycolicibacterium sp. 050158]
MRRSSRVVDLGTASAVRTNDVDEARDLLGRAYLPLDIDPIGCAALDLQMNAADLGVMTAGYVHFGGEVRLRASDVHDYHIDIPLSGQATNAWDDGYEDVAVASVSAGIFMPDMPVDLAWSPDCGQICLMIPAREMLRQLAMMLDHSVTAALEFERRLDLTGPSSASWLDLVNVLVREANRPDGLLSHRLAKANLQHSIIQCLLQMQPHNYTEVLLADGSTSSVRVARRAIELIRAYPETPWTTASLAREMGLSARALQKSFARADEVPPMTYLRHVRLDRARDELLSADPKSVTVTAVAIRWGFLHFGRFAQQYCRRFGESPSATLRGDSARERTMAASS